MKLKPSSMMSLTANLLGNKTNLSSKIKPNKFSEENSIMKREKRFANCNCKEKDKYDELLFIESLYKTPPPNSSLQTHCIFYKLLWSSVVIAHRALILPEY